MKKAILPLLLIMIISLGAWSYTSRSSVELGPCLQIDEINFCMHKDDSTRILIPEYITKPYIRHMYLSNVRKGEQISLTYILEGDARPKKIFAHEDQIPQILNFFEKIFRGKSFTEEPEDFAER